jgi:hypothetical protein
MPLLNVVMLTKKQVKLVLVKSLLIGFGTGKATGELTMQINNGKDGEFYGDFTNR